MSVGRTQLLTLGTDLERAWNHPAATPETRKRILRTVILEIIARVDDDQIDLKIRWQGGDHTQLNVRKARTGKHGWTSMHQQPTLSDNSPNAFRIFESQVSSIELVSVKEGTIRRTKHVYELFAAITGLRFTATVSVQNVES